MLRHAAYFDTLHAIGNPEAPEWHSTAAGLAVLRLVDDWLDFGPRFLTADPICLMTIRGTIARIPARGRVRLLLSRVVDAIELAEASTCAAVALQILSYAQELEREGSIALSRDVVVSLHERAKLANDTFTIAQTSPRLTETGELRPSVTPSKPTEIVVLADVESKSLPFLDQPVRDFSDILEAYDWAFEHLAPVPQQRYRTPEGESVSRAR
jgi:hypothetical protein